MAATALTPTTAVPSISPPVAPRRPRSRDLHGEIRIDEYDWLRDRTNPEVLAHLQAENAWCDAGLGHTAALQQTLYRELLGRLNETDATVPYFLGGWWYYTRTEGGQAYPIYCRRAVTLEAPEEVYLDQNQLAAGHDFHALGGLEVSPDGSRLIYLEDLTGFRDYTLVIRDLRTGGELARLPGVWNGTAWANDNRTILYTRPDAAKRGHAIWRHVLGTEPSQDVLVFRDEDPLFDVTVSRARSGRYLLIESASFSSSEWWAVSADTPGTPARCLAPRRPGVEYEVEHGVDGFYFLTNDGAVNFRVLRAAEDLPDPAEWDEVVPASSEVFLEELDVFREHLVLTERSRGLRRVRIQRLHDRRSHLVTFPEATHGVWLAANPDFGAGRLRLHYSSPVTPPSVYDYDVATETLDLRRQEAVPSGHDASRYRVERHQVVARDGSRIPVTLLLPAEARRDGTRPCLLYAYGAYGVSVDPTFDPEVLSLVNRGFVSAIAHVRGGQELGRRWYDRGKMHAKLNTFHDFIDVAQWLVADGYTRPDRLVAHGESAGGLLVAGVANMRPDLFRAVVADVPFVDVINTMLDATIPLTAQEREQWGDPRKPEDYRYLLRYSPYDNVRAQDYPWLLVTTAMHDSQVMYWEPAKWVARLRALGTDRNPLFFRVHTTGGHSGASGRYDHLREVAFRYAFILEAVRG